MSLQIDKVETADLVRELSPDALRYFTELELSDEWPSHENPRDTKFVRLGEVIILGSAIDHGPKNYRGDRRTIKHLDLIEFGFRVGDDVRGRIEATAPMEDEYLKDKWPLVDAGWAKILTASSGALSGLEFDSGSYDFGKPTLATRQKTGQIALALLGTGIEVTARL